MRRAAREQGIEYPVAQDNDFATWKNFENRYWPAHYLVDKHGMLRHSHHGEGDYAETERLIRELLLERDPSVELPAPIEAANAHNSAPRSPETYLGTARAQFFAHADYHNGTHQFTLGNPLLEQYSLGGTWTLADQPITAGPNARLRLNYHARWVQLVTSGRGTIRLHRADGSVRTFDITQDGTVDLIRDPENHTESIELEVSEGLSLYSFTFG